MQDAAYSVTTLVIILLQPQMLDLLQPPLGIISFPSKMTWTQGYALTASHCRNKYTAELRNQQLQNLDHEVHLTKLRKTWILPVQREFIQAACIISARFRPVGKDLAQNHRIQALILRCWYPSERSTKATANGFLELCPSAIRRSNGSLNTPTN